MVGRDPGATIISSVKTPALSIFRVIIAIGTIQAGTIPAVVPTIVFSFRREWYRLLSHARLNRVLVRPESDAQT
jgi:hypothetical protein